MGDTITMTKDEFNKKCAEATSNMMEKAEKKDGGMSAGFVLMMSAVMAYGELTSLLFPEKE